MICDKTTIWAFDTRLTTLATNTTLATATRHDFTAITIHTPEAPTAGFSIKSAMVVVTIRDAFTAATDIDEVRVGIKLGAVAFDDSDQTFTLATPNDHETITVQRDVTAYFQTNYGTGASQTCQVGVAVATSAIAAVNNITCELYLTYDYDNAAATHCKTVEIPIQGHHTSLGTADVEIGTTGGGVSNAPANQIPQLTGAGTPFLPESGITIRQCYLRITATDNATASFNLFVKIDAGADSTRATIEQALITSASYKDIVDLVAYGMTTTAAHALNMRSSVSGTLLNVSAVLVVTYTFTVSGTTREIHSVRVPLMNDRGNLPPHTSNLAADDDRLSAMLEIQEPGAITMLQSGVIWFDNIAVSVAPALFAPGQTERTISHSGSTYTGGALYVRRCDHDTSSWTLARGTNRLNFHYRQPGTSTIMPMGGLALVNYTADIPGAGVGAGNRTVYYPITDNQTETAGANIVTQSSTPSFPATPWVISGSPFLVYMPRGDLRSNSFVVGAERAAGEDAEDGWASQVLTGPSGIVKATRREFVVPSDWFKKSSYEASSAMALTTARRFKSSGITTHNFAMHMGLTYHSCRFTVSGTVTINGAAAANGKNVQIFAVDGANKVELVATVTTTGGTGSFTATVPDNTRSYFASYDNDSNRGRSALGAPV